MPCATQASAPATPPPPTHALITPFFVSWPLCHDFGKGDRLSELHLHQSGVNLPPPLPMHSNAYVFPTALVPPGALHSVSLSLRVDMGVVVFWEILSSRRFASCFPLLPLPPMLTRPFDISRLVPRRQNLTSWEIMRAIWDITETFSGKLLDIFLPILL